MENNRCFFVKVCHRLVSAVYFVIVPTLIAYEFQALQYTHISMLL